jgi:hypothetical protein
MYSAARIAADLVSGTNAYDTSKNIDAKITHAITNNNKSRGKYGRGCFVAGDLPFLPSLFKRMIATITSMAIRYINVT